MWEVYVEKEGKYRAEISRWPFHLNRNLNAAGPEISIGKTLFAPGKALPVHYGCFAVNNEQTEVKSLISDASKVTYDVELISGRSTFQAWFMNKEKQDLCGAYFLRLEKLDE